MRRYSALRIGLTFVCIAFLYACAPDLRVRTVSLSPQCPSTVDQIIFTAEIENRGRKSAGASTLSFRVGEEAFSSLYSVPPLGPGDTHLVQRPLVLGVAQYYQNIIKADVYDDVSESQENNNERRQSYFVINPVDRVCLINISGNSSGILVDAQFAGVYQNDNTFISSAQAIPVGNASLGMHNEVIAYTNHRPVEVVENANWTNSNNDNVPVEFENTIRIPVKVWIVKGPFDKQRQRVLDAYATTAAVWEDERMGIAFSKFEIVDATSNPNASNYYKFDLSLRTNMENDIGKTAGMINIYYVKKVDGDTGRGVALIGGDFVAMGKYTGDELLVHEIGHNFALAHIDGLTNYDRTNVMHSASNTREYFTEGQTFRAHIKGDSAINSIYNARPGKPTRNCSRSVISHACLRNDKRIWADRVFPAN